MSAALTYDDKRERAIKATAKKAGRKIVFTHADDINEGDVLWFAVLALNPRVAPKVFRIEAVKVLDDGKMGKPKVRVHCKSNVAGRYFHVRPGDVVFKEIA